MSMPTRLLFVAALGALLASGCATRGPNHVYATVAGDRDLHDLGATGRATLPAVGEGEQVIGLAYDFNTDHLFVRIAPAQVIRVIERPSGKILREMPLPADLHTAAPADLAIRSSDRHLFAMHPDGRSVIELTLFGEALQRRPLVGIVTGITGLAFDQNQSLLLALDGQVVRRFDAAGRPAGTVRLLEPVTAVSLAFDSEGRRFFVPLADGRTLGEFDAEGRLQDRHAFPGDAAITGLDAGQRSFVRVF